MINNLIELPQLLCFHVTSFRKVNEVTFAVRKYHQRFLKNSNNLSLYKYRLRLFNTVYSTGGTAS